jgi:molybdate transport system ATP-binding protein
MSWHLSLEVTLGTLAIDVSLTGDGGTTVLTGPNGAGKTTLLRWFAGTLGTGRGRVTLADRDLHHDDAGVCLSPEARGVGFLPQGFALFPHLRVVDNVAFGLAVRGVARADRRDQARAQLAALGAESLAERWPRELSGGEQQRVAIARALVVRPGVLLLDEPLAAIDARARRRLRGVLAQQLVDLGVPALVVTHDVRDAAALEAHVVVLEDGHVVQQGSVAALREAPATDFVAEFVGVV